MEKQAIKLSTIIPEADEVEWHRPLSCDTDEENDWDDDDDDDDDDD